MTVVENPIVETTTCQHEGEQWHNYGDVCAINKNGITRPVSRCKHCGKFVARKKPWLNEWEVIDTK